MFHVPDSPSALLGPSRPLRLGRGALAVSCPDTWAGLRPAWPVSFWCCPEPCWQQCFHVWAAQWVMLLSPENRGPNSQALSCGTLVAASLLFHAHCVEPFVFPEPGSLPLRLRSRRNEEPCPSCWEPQAQQRKPCGLTVPYLTVLRSAKPTQK